jgi:DNA-binding beta-propeller fold protein YncE
VSETGSGGQCADGRALAFANVVAVSHDGANLYASAALSNAVAVFARNQATGALAQLAGTDGCVSETGSGGLCADGRALEEPITIGLDPESRNLYVGAATGNAVAVFARDPGTGALAQPAGGAGCVRQGGGEGCGPARFLERPTELAVSPDGANVYMTAIDSRSVAVFARH